MSPPAHHKSIAKHLFTVCPGLRVTEMRASGTAHTQAIAEMPSFPAPGYVTYATIGLSDHGSFELLTTTPERFKSVMKAVFDLASSVAAGNRKLVAGATFEKILGRYYAQSESAHLLLRNEAPKSIVIAPYALATGTVTWLTAWPITSDELVWLGGGAALGPLLDEADLRAFDLDRGSLDGVPSFDPWAAKG